MGTTGTDDEQEFARRMQRKRGIRFCADCETREGDRLHVPLYFHGIVDSKEQMIGGWSLAAGRCPVCEQEALVNEYPCTKRANNPASTRCSDARGLQSSWCSGCKGAVAQGLLVPTNRQSGRTTDALRNAVSMAKSGRHVQYVVHATNMTPVCIDLMREHNMLPVGKVPEADGQFRFNGGGTLRFVLPRGALTQGSYGETIWDHHARDLQATMPSEAP